MQPRKIGSTLRSGVYLVHVPCHVVALEINRVHVGVPVCPRTSPGDTYASIDNGKRPEIGVYGISSCVEWQAAHLIGQARVDERKLPVIAGVVVGGKGYRLDLDTHATEGIPGAGDADLTTR